MIERGEAAVGFVAGIAACDDDDRTLACGQRLVRRRFVSGLELERTADAYDLIDIRLQRCGNAEVVHRRAQDEYVRSEEFIDQCIAQR